MVLRMPELGGGCLGPSPRVGAFQAGAHHPFWKGVF